VPPAGQVDGLRPVVVATGHRPHLAVRPAVPRLHLLIDHQVDAAELVDEFVEALEIEDRAAVERLDAGIRTESLREQFVTLLDTFLV
jgi:hypothetical protein